MPVTVKDISYAGINIMATIFGATGVAAATYYAAVLYRFYGKAVLSKVNGSAEADDEAAVFETDEQEDEATGMLVELEHLVNSIRTDIFEQAGKQADKSNLMVAIKALAANFSGLHRPAYRNALNNFIIKYGEELCGAGFSEEELEAAWRSLQS